MGIKEKIKHLRKSRGWTTTVLAQKAGIAQSTVSYIETGKTKPSLQILEKIANALGVGIVDLLGDVEKADLVSKIENEELLNQFGQIKQLNKKDQETVKAIIDVFLEKRPIRKSSS